MAPRLLILDHFAELGGGELALLRSLPALGEAFDLRVAVPGPGPLVDSVRQAGVTVLDRPFPAAQLSHERLNRVRGAAHLAVGSAGYVARLRSDVRRWRPDLVYANSLKSAVYGQALAASLARPWVWHLRDRLEVGYLGREAVAALRTLAVVGPRLLVANATGTRDLLPERARRRCVVIPSPIEVERFAAVAAARRPRPGGPVVVAVVGRLTPVKGQALVIDALARVAREHDVRLRLVGGDLTVAGGQRADLEQQAVQLGVGHLVSFTGHVERVEDELADVDVLVSYPAHPEPFGQAVVQAMAAGVTVLAAAEGGPAEVVEDGRTGLLVPPRDPDALAEALARLITDVELRQRLAQRARGAAAAYAADVTLPRLVAALQQACRSRRRP